MTIDFLASPDRWIAAWRAILEESPTFETAAQGWGEGFDGSILLAVGPDGAAEDPPSFYVEPHDGGIETVRVLDDPEGADAGFRIAAPFRTWKRLIGGELHPEAAVSSGEFAFEGDPVLAMEYREAVTIMAAAASAIDTEFSG